MYVNSFVCQIIFNVLQNNQRIILVILRTEVLIHNYLVNHISYSSGVSKIRLFSEILHNIKKTY